MAHKSPEVEAYIHNLTPDRKEALETLRRLVFEQVPEVEETFKYRMPTYQWPDEGEVLCSFASQKHYISLYMDVDLVEKHREGLGDLDCGKSCIRFKRLEELPLDTIKTILRETIDKQQAGQLSE